MIRFYAAFDDLTTTEAISNPSLVFYCDINPDRNVTGSAVPDVTPYQFAFATQVNLTKPNGFVADQLSGATEFSPLTTGAQHGYTNVYSLDLNGVTPTFSGFNNWDTGAEPDLIAGQINIIVFTKIYNQYWYFWGTAYTGTIAMTQLTAPVVTVASAGQTQLNISVNANVNGVEVYISTTSGGTYSLYETLVASDLTCEPLTGLTQGTIRYFKAIALGDNLSTLDSELSIEYSGTTSTVIQLTAPTAGAVTVVSSTALTPNVSGVDANATYLKLEYKLTSSGTWLTHSATLPRTTLSVPMTGLVSNSSYDFRWTAIGDGVSYSDSNPSSTATGSTLATPPTFVSAATSTDGLTIGVIYSKTMPASPTYSGMSFSGTTSGTHAATGATRDGSNTSKVNYSIASACVNGETVTANYTAGNIVANDGGVLASFTGQSVTNNVVATLSANILLDVDFSQDDRITTAGGLVSAYNDLSDANNDMTSPTDKQGTHDQTNDRIAISGDNGRLECAQSSEFYNAYTEGLSIMIDFMLPHQNGNAYLISICNSGTLAGLTIYGDPYGALYASIRPAQSSVNVTFTENLRTKLFFVWGLDHILRVYNSSNTLVNTSAALTGDFAYTTEKLVLGNRTDDWGGGTATKYIYKARVYNKPLSAAERTTELAR